jgi:hypothetical protein
MYEINSLCIVLTISRAEFRKYCKGIELRKKESHVGVWNGITMIKFQ